MEPPLKWLRKGMNVGGGWPGYYDEAVVKQLELSGTASDTDRVARLVLKCVFRDILEGLLALKGKGFCLCVGA